jgi:flagellar basal body-associated protein FliL
MKLIIIGVIVVVLLAGGGGAAYFFRADLFGDTAAQKAPIAKTADALFVDLESITIAVIRNRRIEKHVVLQLSLEVPDEESRSAVSHALPRVKDAFIKDLYDYYAVQPPGREGINVEAIKKRLKRTADEVMGPGKVRAVLIQGAVERAAGDS